MSGQYPSGYQSPSGHRGNFNSPMMQQQLGGGAGGGVPSQMGFNQGMQQNQQMQGGGQSGGGGELGMNPNQMAGGQQPTGGNQAGGQQQQQAAGQGAAQQSQAPQQSPQSGQQGQGGGNMMAPAGAPGPVATTGQPNMQQQKEFNLLTLCRIGQETVQDIVSRFQEVFGILRVIQPPNGTNQGLTASNDKKAKVQEQFRTIRLLFKRLRLLYDKCNDFCQQGMEYTHVEGLIPVKGEPERTEPVHTEEYKKAMQENRELIEIVMLKNKQLREIIDKIRLTIWEINTMLSMRRC
ncbi:thyroid hormone receptor-associated protein 6 [Culex quinquefasciatus]|uniref:Mediator of RNA polymerase II transcription subunit 30 n=1 Tax=Culex quinquefasciatus TaxID=7176 RepID=B0WCG5_CULQU|nr:thyroid hormone receptor-associated protein 6 [Culex quinquefasciatus]|eukprot:XP_001846399.1 thyroid hormone receptor-associated protein 6 [Culex quinquefasciatus]